MSPQTSSNLASPKGSPLETLISRVFFLSLVCTAIISCSTPSEPEENVTNEVPPVTYFCSDTTEIKISRSPTSVPPTVTLTIDGESAVLEQGPAASGAKFSDGNLTWWEKGDTGLIMLGNETIHRDCRIIW